MLDSWTTGCSTATRSDSGDLASRQPSGETGNVLPFPDGSPGFLPEPMFASWRIDIDRKRQRADGKGLRRKVPLAANILRKFHASFSRKRGGKPLLNAGFPVRAVAAMRGSRKLSTGLLVGCVVLTVAGCGSQNKSDPSLAAPKPSWATALDIHPDYGDPAGRQHVNDSRDDRKPATIDIRSATLRRGVRGDLGLTVRVRGPIRGDLIFQFWYWVTPNRGDLVDVRTGGGMPPRIVSNKGEPSRATTATIQGRTIRLHLAYRDMPFRNSAEAFRWRATAATRGVFPEVSDGIGYRRFGDA